jgi:hypothetical protein
MIQFSLWKIIAQFMSLSHLDPVPTHERKAVNNVVILSPSPKG